MQIICPPGPSPGAAPQPPGAAPQPLEQEARSYAGPGSCAPLPSAAQGRSQRHLLRAALLPLQHYPPPPAPVKSNCWSLLRGKLRARSAGALSAFTALSVAGLLSAKAWLCSPPPQFHPFSPPAVGARGRSVVFSAGRERGQRHRGGAGGYEAPPQLPCVNLHASSGWSLQLQNHRTLG